MAQINQIYLSLTARTLANEDQVFDGFGLFTTFVGTIKNVERERTFPFNNLFVM